MSSLFKALGSYVWGDPVREEKKEDNWQEEKHKEERSEQPKEATISEKTSVQTEEPPVDRVKTSDKREKGEKKAQKSEKKNKGEVDIDMDQIPPEDLLVNDCSGCHEPCAEHEQYPSYLDLDNETPLLGTMKPYGRHILISTAKMDWAERIEEENNTIAARLSQIVSSHPTELRTIITNTSMPSTHSTVPRSQDIFILPENIIVSNVTPNDSQLIFDLFVKPPLSDQPVTLKTYQSLNLKSLKVGLNPYKSMILICSHKRRDKRCGITAPLLYHELDYVLREKEVDENDTVILYVSHVGGHKYAGNVICYVDYGKVGVWYGRVKTCHCKEIVEETVLKGKVIKELYRGSMKKSFGTDKCNRFKW